MGPSAPADRPRLDQPFWIVAIPAALLMGAGMTTGQGTGWFFFGFAVLAIFYAERGASTPLWLVSVLSVIYGALVIFGSGPYPLAASLLLLLAVAIWTRGRRVL
jgi:hypothetical protein